MITKADGAKLINLEKPGQTGKIFEYVEFASGNHRTYTDITYNVDTDVIEFYAYVPRSAVTSDYAVFFGEDSAFQLGIYSNGTPYVGNAAASGYNVFDAWHSFKCVKDDYYLDGVNVISRSNVLNGKKVVLFENNASANHGVIGAGVKIAWIKYYRNGELFREWKFGRGDGATDTLMVPGYYNVKNSHCAGEQTGTYTRDLKCRYIREVLPSPNPKYRTDLPAEYTQLERVQTLNTRLVTPFSPKNSQYPVLELEYQMTATGDTDYWGTDGTVNGEIVWDLNISGQGSTSATYIRWGNGTSAQAYSPTTGYTLHDLNSVLTPKEYKIVTQAKTPVYQKIDGVWKQIGTINNTEPNFSVLPDNAYFCLGGARSSSAGNSWWHYCKWYERDTGELLFDGVAVKRNSDGEPGFYDFVSDTFLYSTNKIEAGAPMEPFFGRTLYENLE